MTFAAPWLLLVLAILPALWWLLRVTPPAPRKLAFPPVRLLRDIVNRDETPARTPLWLLLLRLAAAALLVIGLADPLLGARGRMGGGGTRLVVLDDDWAAAADWPLRVAAADRVLAEAERDGEAAALLTTAPAEDGGETALIGPLRAQDLRGKLAALSPKPWPPDRAAAGRALTATTFAPRSTLYVSDGLVQDPSGWQTFAAALRATVNGGNLAVVAASAAPGRLLHAAAVPEGWRVSVAQTPRPLAEVLGVRAETADGRVLARVALTVPPGRDGADASVVLPPPLRNRVDRLVLDAGMTQATTAAGTVLVDEADRRRPVGLLSGEAVAQDVLLTSPGYYLRRALGPFAEWHEGTLNDLLRDNLSVLLLPDRPLAAGAEADRLREWVERGGLLVRFAGPEMAQAAQDEQPDPLLPVSLLPAEREMGGSMSWSRPATLGTPPADSPFAGLPLPPDVTVSRQVLADPGSRQGNAVWAQLVDGTPLVTARPVGSGRLVLFHVTANADWSNLPLSGLFVDMLRRLVALSTGVRTPATAGVLAPTRSLDAFGGWRAPPEAARPIEAAALDAAVAGPAHPAGLYGPEGNRRVLNVAQNLAAPAAAPVIDGANAVQLGPANPVRPLGPLLVAIAALLLIVDLALSLRARGLVGAAVALLLMLVLPQAARAEDAAAYDPALATRLAHVVTGVPSLDDVAQAGLVGLSAFVNARTAATLAEPRGVVLGRDDLSFYPLLYWPIGSEAAALGSTALAALQSYMATGGVLLIDTRDGGSGSGMTQGARDVLRRMGGDLALDAPPLAPLTSAHVLARSFYLLSDFPGRYDGDTVWVARDTDRSNDSVSPMIIGGHDWASAWAVDESGQHPFATLPGGERQRTLAYRFGVNLVMYALTGNYKGDQVHVPALLQRLGQ